MNPQFSMPNPPMPLPQVPGPKLSPFTPDAHAEIKFMEELGSSDDQDGQVWKAEINGTTYALKMAYVDYYDPFNCECRAYGRLAQEGRLDLAIPAHGYLLLTPQQEAEVTPMITNGLEYKPDDEEPLGTLDGEKQWGRWEEHRGQPIRAIVKEFVEDNNLEEAFNTGRISASTMWRDLEDLHALGILVRDIHFDNYIGGKLIDFSRAWTMYHPGLDRIHHDNLTRFRMDDTHDLLVMLQDWWVATPAVKELEIPDSLYECDAGRNDYGTDPRVYDWLRWEDDGEAAAEYVQGELFASDTRASEY